MQAVREALFEKRLQRVVVGAGDGIFREDAVENLGAIGGASNTGSGLAKRRSVGTRADQSNGDTSGSASDGAGRGGILQWTRHVGPGTAGAVDVRHAKGLALVQNELIHAVFAERSATLA